MSQPAAEPLSARILFIVLLVLVALSGWATFGIAYFGWQASWAAEEDKLGQAQDAIEELKRLKSYREQSIQTIETQGQVNELLQDRIRRLEAQLRRHGLEPVR